MRRLPIVAVLFVAACSSAPELRYSVPQIDPGSGIAVSARHVEVRDVTLPTYAAEERIYIQQEDGALVASDALLWSDDPRRAMTLTLARTLNAVTSARVAPEPWPFDALPDAEVQVRVDEMVAEFGGTFRLSGQYFVGAPGGTLRERAHAFDIRIAYDVAGGVQSIARARATAVRDLAREIAAEAL